ncbi:unnamed protein product [Bursaphelenchus okinawaensis]|uniref:Uncharacterized protein n=1 Tax=Bursaphelenchus okinawaensis TaxID=465554 RepID=A0A811KR75_9BILA|nr:unnamed protein product [Bursaphelenchus okinawaensis]CAG9109426.1 unnamed protein product [Bursaphelenchus okinawaensis]
MRNFLTAITEEPNITRKRSRSEVLPDSVFDFAHLSHNCACSYLMSAPSAQSVLTAEVRDSPRRSSTPDVEPDLAIFRNGKKNHDRCFRPVHSERTRRLFGGRGGMELGR